MLFDPEALSPKFHNHAMIDPEVVEELSVKNDGRLLQEVSAVKDATGGVLMFTGFKIVSRHPVRFVTTSVTVFNPVVTNKC